MRAHDVAAFGCYSLGPGKPDAPLPFSLECSLPEVWKSDSGAKSSVKMSAYHLIDAGLLRLIADRLGYGAEKYGDADNYKQGVSDPVYIRDRENHLFAHVLKYMAAPTLAERQKQMSAIGANLSMLAYLDANRPK